MQEKLEKKILCTLYVVFPQGQCLNSLNGQGGHWSPSWQVTSHIWYPHANFLPHLSSHCHWGSEQWHSFCCFLHEHNWTLFLLQGGQIFPSWHGIGQKCCPHDNFFLHGLPQDQSLSKHLLVAGAVCPQKHLDLTTFGHGGQGPITLKSKIRRYISDVNSQLEILKLCKNFAHLSLLKKCP